MEGCPGYAPELVLIGAERIVGSGHSCRHLRAQPDLRRRGAYVSACTHPLIGVPENGNGGQPGTMRYSTAGAPRSVLDT
jgi:hypothetical protein